MPKPRPPYLHREETRHGLVAWYVRRGRGQRIRIKAEYGSPDFWAQYRAAVEGAPSSALKTPKAHTLAWAVERYRSSSAWGALAASTRRQWENVLRNVIKTAGGALLRDITNATVRDGRERRASTPHAANHFLKAMRHLFRWACEEKLVPNDPTKGVKMLAGKNDADGFQPGRKKSLTVSKRGGRSARESGSPSTSCSIPACAVATPCGSGGNMCATASSPFAPKSIDKENRARLSTFQFSRRLRRRSPRPKRAILRSL
jgi:hypothetical protein